MEFFSRALTRYLEWCIQRKTFHAPSSLFFCSWKEKTQAEKIRELREWSGVVSRKQKSVLNFNKRTFLLSNRTARIELLILSALATRKIYDLKVELTKAAGFEDKARNERSSETRRKTRLLPETTNFRSISKAGVAVLISSKNFKFVNHPISNIANWNFIWNFKFMGFLGVEMFWNIAIWNLKKNCISRNIRKIFSTILQ